MENNQRLRTFLLQFISEVAEDPRKLTTLLNSVAKAVELLGHGGREFIKTLKVESASHYLSLIYRVAKRSFGVDHSEARENEMPSSDIECAESSTETSSDEDEVSTRLEQPRRKHVPPSWERLRSRLEFTRRSREASQQTPEIFSAYDIHHSTPLPEAIGLPSQSTPLRPDSFALPANIAQDVSVRYSSIPRHKRKRAPPLPVIRDDQAEQHYSDIKQTSDGTLQVRDYIKRSLEQIQRRRTFEALFNDSDIVDLPTGQDFVEQMEELFAERRRNRTEHRVQRRQGTLPNLPMDQLPHVAPNIVTAQRVSDHQDYFTWNAKDYILQNFMAKMKATLEIQEDVHFRLSASIGDLRAAEPRSVNSSISHPLSSAQQSNLILIRPEVIPEENGPSFRMPRPASLLPESLLAPESALAPESLQPEPISVQESLLVPEFVGRLIDEDPLTSPMHLRTRDGVIYAGMDRSTVGPSRRKRRRRNQNVGREEQAEPFPQRQSSSACVMPILSPVQPENVDTRAQIISRMTGEEPDGDYYKRKYKEWREALVEKRLMKPSNFQNDLTHIRKIESLCKQTQNLLATISSCEYLPIKDVFTPEMNKKMAVQRVEVLLELNTRKLIALRRDENCSVIGVENLAFNAHIEAAPSKSNQVLSISHQPPSKLHQTPSTSHRIPFSSNQISSTSPSD